MHGVSSPFIRRGMQVFGFTDQAVVEVTEQKDPDPEFPTVVFPNPEEKGKSIMSTHKRLNLRFIGYRSTRELLLEVQGIPAY
jgi:phosphomannomutase